ncbi:MAG: helix-turn-helix domain-containing protein [Candidatus Bathyarchaeia archaeon]
MIEALLNIRIPELWVTPITEKYDVEVTCQIGGHSGKAGWGMVTVKGNDALIDRVVEDIRAHPSVGRVQAKDRQEGVASFVVDVVRCNACRILITSKSFMVYPVAISKGRMKWLLITDTNKTVGRLSRALEHVGCDVILERLTPLTVEGVLTERQKDVIRVAFESGYFDFPRRVSSVRLANQLGVSVSTLSEVMRAAQRRIFAEYLKC